jgi:hypothetical protein
VRPRSVTEHLAFQAFVSEASRVSGERRDGKIYLQSVAVTLALHVPDTPTANGVVDVEVTAEHRGLPKPIHFTAVGFGENLEAAAKAAAEQWFQVVFPVLHSLYAEHETAEGSTATISAIRRPAGEQFQWRVIAGPVRVIAGDAREPATAPNGEILEALKHEITGVCAAAAPFWVNAYLAVHADGTPVGYCRLTNELWPEATSRLTASALELLGAGGEFHSWRQFLFFEPAAEHAVPFERFPKERPWWKRIIGVAE